MRIKRIALLVLVVVSTTVVVEAQAVKFYNYPGSETCVWVARDYEREIIMTYGGLFGRIVTQAPEVPAYLWLVLSPESGKPIAEGGAMTPDEAVHALCGGLIRIIGTGGAAPVMSVRPEAAYQQLLDVLRRGPSLDTRQ